MATDKQGDVKTKAGLRMLQEGKYQIDSLLLQLEVDSNTKLTGTVCCFSNAVKPATAEPRSRQIMKMLEQEKPGDLITKAVVAKTLLPFVRIGKIIHSDAGNPGPVIAQAYGCIADAILKSLKCNTNSKVEGFYRKNGMVVLRLENFELPNEGWSPSWNGDGSNVPCLFGLRVLEKLQMADPPIIASLNDEDQEDLEAALEDEDIEGILDEYDSIKAKVAADISEQEETARAEPQAKREAFKAIQDRMQKENATGEVKRARALLDRRAQMAPEVEDAVDDELTSVVIELDLQIAESEPVIEYSVSEQASDKKRQLEESDTPDCDERSKKVKSTGTSSASHKRSREDEEPDMPDKKMKTDDEPLSVSASNSMGQLDDGEKPVENLSAAEATSTGKMQRERGPQELSQLKFKATHTNVLSGVPSELEAEVTRLSTSGSLHNATVPKLKQLLKDWNYRSPAGQKAISKMNKPELLRVIQGLLEQK